MSNSPNLSADEQRERSLSPTSSRHSEEESHEKSREASNSNPRTEYDEGSNNQNDGTNMLSYF